LENVPVTSRVDYFLGPVSQMNKIQECLIKDFTPEASSDHCLISMVVNLSIFMGNPVKFAKPPKMKFVHIETDPKDESREAYAKEVAKSLKSSKWLDRINAPPWSAT